MTALALLASFSLGGCSNFTKAGRQQHAYEKICASLQQHAGETAEDVSFRQTENAGDADADRAGSPQQ